MLGTIAALSRQAKTAFAAASAEHLWPVVVRYAAAASLSGQTVDTLRDGLDQTWRVAHGESEDVSRVASFAEASVPEEDEALGPVSGYAQNAIAAIAYAARTWTTDSAQEAVWSARQVYEAADLAAHYAGDGRIHPDDSDVVHAALSLLHADLEAASAGRLVELERQARAGALEFAQLLK